MNAYFWGLITGLLLALAGIGWLLYRGTVIFKK